MRLGDVFQKFQIKVVLSITLPLNKKQDGTRLNPRRWHISRLGAIQINVLI